MAGLRVVKLMPGFGPAHAARLLDVMADAADPLAAALAFQPPASASEEWDAFISVYRTLRHPGLEWPADLDLAKRWYAPHLERIYEDAPQRRVDIDNLERMAAAYPNRERFLSELTLDPPEATSAESGRPHLDEDYLILSTIHSAKGQEWTSVTLLNAVDGCIPSDMATGNDADIEEERRLVYVAMTRAKVHLQVMVPHRFYTTQQAGFGDRHIYASRTRFIPDALAAVFETVVWPIAASQDLFSKPGKPPVMQIRDRARAAWR